jgi:hypothetical protein
MATAIKHRHYGSYNADMFFVKIQYIQPHISGHHMHLPTYNAPYMSQGHDPFSSNMPRLEVVTARTIKTVNRN